MGFRLNLKGVFPVPSHFLANSHSRLLSSGVFVSKDPLKAYASPPALQTLENGCLEIEEMKVNIDKGSKSHSSSHTMIVKTHEPIGGNKSSFAQAHRHARHHVIV